MAAVLEVKKPPQVRPSCAFGDTHPLSAKDFCKVFRATHTLMHLGSIHMVAPLCRRGTIPSDDGRSLFWDGQWHIHSSKASERKIAWQKQWSVPILPIRPLLSEPTLDRKRTRAFPKKSQCNQGIYKAVYLLFSHVLLWFLFHSVLRLSKLSMP